MRSADVRLVIGTRPEAIKLAPLAKALAQRGRMPSLVLTGQQRVRPAEFGLHDYPALRLDCPGREDPDAHVRDVAAAIGAHALHAELVVVQGDTSSAMGAALATFHAGISVAHVEAGLRTYDQDRPWPEEGYRTTIDARADLLFAPTAGAGRNLRREQVRGEVHVTGNTGIDALLAAEAALPPPTQTERGSPTVLVTCHRRESCGEGLERIAAALIQLARDDSAAIEMVLHPNPHVADAMRQLLGGIRNIVLIDPCGHVELVRRMRDADLILSDSGGIQEEAPALGSPLLVLRDKTERPEGVAAGNARLVGTETARIVDQARLLLSDPLARAAMSRRSFPFGDGQTAPRIASIIEEWLERGGKSSRKAAPW